MGSMGEGELESLNNLCKVINEKLGPQGMETLSSLIDNFSNNITEHTEFSKSIHRLFENHAKPKQDHVLTVRANVDESIKEYHPIHHIADVGVRVKVDEHPREDVSKEGESEKYVNDLKMNLEGNNRSNLHWEPSQKKRRMSPNYRLIPEEEQCPVKYEVLNNKCSLVKYEAFEHKKLTKYEKAMEKGEDGMSKADRSMEWLRSAVGKAEKVLKGELKVKDLGVMFYKCIEELCHVDVFERVRQDYKKALPETLPLLKQELNNLTVARAKQKYRLKKVIEENTAKQRESTAAQRQGGKQHTFVSDFV